MPSSKTDNLKDAAKLPAVKRPSAASASVNEDIAPELLRRTKEQTNSLRISSGKDQRNLLLMVLKNPQVLAQLTLKQWDLLLRYARQTRLLSRLAINVRELNIEQEIPEPVRPHLISALAISDRHERIVRWEFNRLQLALRDVAGPLVLLKGAAYLAAGLPISKGRIYSDIDLLVPAEQLESVEKELLKVGWRVGAIDPRDARYFRAWLHELPPMKHRHRRSMLDVHHTILPRTDKLQVDPKQLLAEAWQLPESRLYVLSPADMVLHSAAHLFRNGDFSQAVRDLLDLDGMIRNFSEEPTFWQTLIARAKLHNLQLPCFCGLRYAAKYFQTPLSEEIQQEMNIWQPNRLSLAIIDRLVDRALLPKNLECPDSGRDWAISLLAHWPVPRWQAMFTGIFWAKRLPNWSQDQQANKGQNLTDPEQHVPDRPE